MNLTKDTQTSIAGVVAAVALIPQWILGTFFAYKLDIGADVLNAIAILAGLFIAWKVGKKGNNTFIVLIVAAFFLCAAPAFASGDKTLGWDAYTDAADGFKLYCARSANVEPIAANLQATITPSTVTQYKKTGFASGEWWCAMTAYNPTQESVKSNEISFTVPLDPPNNLKIIEAVITMILNKRAGK